MLYEVIILVFLILLFCFFTMTLTVNVVISFYNSARPEGTKEVKTILPKRPPKKTKEQIEEERKAAEERRQYEIIMRNLEAFDGTGIGQEEVR